MAVPRLVLGAVLVALLAAPLAAAASAHGAVDIVGTAEAPGPATLDATHGALVWNTSSIPTLDLKAASFTVETWGEDNTIAHLPTGQNVQQPKQGAPTQSTLGAGTLRLEQGSGAQWLVLDSIGAIHATVTDAKLRPVSSILLATGPAESSNAAGCLSADCVDERGVYELASGATQADLSGDVVLVLHGPTAIVTAGGQDTRLTTGSTSTDTASVTQTHDSWAIVTIHQASGTLAGDRATWYAASPILAASEIVAPKTTGDLKVGLRSYSAAEEALQATGTLTLTPASVAPTTPESSGPHYASGFSMQVQGDITSINLHAQPVYADAPAQAAAGGLVGLAAIAALLAYLWPRVSFHLTAAALPLYTRLKQPEILANEVRNSIYEIIRAHPGISAREVHRQSDQSWGTVVYHLRQLERHHLVVSRSVGRTRNYYENHGKYRGMEVQLACLQSSRARALAHLVNVAPGITQEDLAAQSGYPQPTTSYYVRKLKGASLVEERRDGRYARYHPMPELTRFLQLADAPVVDPKADLPSDAVQA